MSRMRFLIVMFLILMAPVAWAQKTDNNYYQAVSDKYLGELLAAVEKYHLQQGIDATRNKHYLYAWGDLKFILNYFPNHPKALIAMGNLCEVWQDRRCNMSLYFEKALQISPENDGVHLTRGVYLQKHGKLADAIESYKKALELNPNSANTHYNLGLAYVVQKNFEFANEHAQEAYSLGITLPGLQNKLLQAKAWKPLPPKPSPDTTKDQTKSEKPTEAKPTDTEIKSNDGSK